MVIDRMMFMRQTGMIPAPGKDFITSAELRMPCVLLQHRPADAGERWPSTTVRGHLSADAMPARRSARPPIQVDGGTSTLPGSVRATMRGSPCPARCSRTNELGASSSRSRSSRSSMAFSATPLYTSLPG